MFIYIARIISNKIFSIKKSILILIIIFSIINFIEIDTTTLSKLIERKINIIKLEESKTLIKFFNINKSIFTLIIILNLLISLISITNITNSKEGPLKKTYV